MHGVDWDDPSCVHFSKCYKEKPGESYEKIVKKIQKHFDCERKDIPI